MGERLGSKAAPCLWFLTLCQSLRRITVLDSAIFFVKVLLILFIFVVRVGGKNLDIHSIDALYPVMDISSRRYLIVAQNTARSRRPTKKRYNNQKTTAHCSSLSCS